MSKPFELDFDQRLSLLSEQQEALLSLENSPIQPGNGVFHRWENPVVTRDHVPLDWRYDLDPASNPYLMERIGVNSTFNAGAIFWEGRYLLAVRVEGVDRKSFFAIAESESGVDNFRFWPRPLTMPETDEPDTNVYDIRLTQHEDGYIYGLFCTERKDTSRADDTSAALAACGIARTTDLENWQRLPDLKTASSQQRNVVLHPEFVDGKYALYTRPQDGFIEVGDTGGICWGLCSSMENAEVHDELLIDPRRYHTITESKNGQGPAPLKTDHGWLHLGHGVRNTAAGLRYVLYLFMTDPEKPWQIKHQPAGYLVAPVDEERVGDVSNVVFSNGWIRNGKDEVFIYYASSDTRTHVATSTIDRLVDYCVNTPEDGLRSAESVEAINRLISKNRALTGGKKS